MIAPAAYAALLVLAALVEIMFPGRALYHEGWFNVALAALIVLLGMAMPKVIRALRSRRARASAVVAAVAVGICGFAAIVSGLLGPDAHTIVAAPGQTIRLGELGGALVFPLREGTSTADVMLERGSAATPIGARRFDGSFLLERVPRSVVSVEATDARGGHLTITQPTGAAFLSPVLLMQSTQSIAGMTVPYDSFSVPAAHRAVKVILFDAQQAAQLPALRTSSPAVLFDVENEREQEVPGGIGPARDGERVVLGGVGLRPSIFDYPAIRIISVPNLPVTIAGAVLAVAALLFAAATERGKPATPVPA